MQTVDHRIGGDAPRVSVVIPCYNAAGFIAETLDSVFAQRYAAYEVLVVNDGSPDTPELEAVLAPYLPRLRYIRQPNRGPGGARNTGIQEARGEYVAFLDSDDLWEPEFLTEQMRMLETDPSLDLVYADALLFGDTPHAGRTFMEGAPSQGEATFESLVALRCLVITSCVVARRSALIDAGLFDERFFHSEDFDLWARLAHRGGRIGYQRAVLARHRAHAASLSAEANSLIRGQMAVSRKFLQTLEVTPEQRSLLERHVAWCEAQLQLTAGKQHLLQGRYRESRAALADANRVLRSWKVTCSQVALRLAPDLLRRIYLMRHRGPAAPATGGSR